MSATSTATGYPAGQCTAYVASKLSWVPHNWGNASGWLSDAQNDGLTVINGSSLASVQPGDVAVIGSNTSTANGKASSDGHVGIVTAVDAATGTVTLSSENWPEGDNSANLLTFNQGDIEGYIIPPAGATTPASLLSNNSSSSTPWYDQLPVVGGALTAGQSIATIGSDLLDPSTYITIAWFGISIVLVFMGVRLILNKGSGAGTVINVGKSLGKLAPEAAVAA